MRSSRSTAIVVLLLALAFGCKQRANRQAAPQSAASIAWFILPATFSGVLPCADCSGIRYTLNLFPDRVFYLRETYLGKGEGEGDSFYDLGSWSFSEDGETLTLKGGREAPLLFSAKSPEILRKLDLDGGEIESALNYDLTRAGQFEFFKVNAFVRGMYSYMADAGIFTECFTGKKFPVAQEGDNAALEAAYLKARQQPGEALLVNFEGNIVRRPKMEGEGEQEVIIVDRFNNVWPDETCASPISTPALEQTYWKLLELNGQPVAAEAGSREAHLQLSPSGATVAGSTGCNQVMGKYELDDESLRFSKMATTRMACPEALMAQESAFLKALETAAAWKISGNRLELKDVHGTVLARFEAKK
jgi:copper homeostasis protein (lipoprotein)